MTNLQHPGPRAHLVLITALAALPVLPRDLVAQPTVVTIGDDLVFRINGHPAFPIGFTKAPPPDATTPEGRDAYAALRRNGAVFHRCGFGPGQWNPTTEAELDHMLDRSAQTGLLCAIYIADLTNIGPTQFARANELRRVVAKYRDHPGVGYWKGADEPEWGRVPVDNVQRFTEIVHELDPNHPVWITQAPRGTIDSLRQYDPTYDVVAIDIYPIGYPPARHAHLPNPGISVVGDYALWLQQVTDNRKPFWMILQIAWSGVVQPDKTLRFPTFPEQRYMTYQSIINGARGLAWFGGHIELAMSDRDRGLGWNWRFYRKVLEPVLQELRPGGPVWPALVAPASDLPIALSGADDVELCVRETVEHLYVIAAKREGATVRARFSGLPLPDGTVGTLLFEEPRTVTVADQSFSDWFGPNEVHVYRFDKPKSVPRRR